MHTSLIMGFSRGPVFFVAVLVRFWFGFRSGHLTIIFWVAYNWDTCRSTRKYFNLVGRRERDGLWKHFTWQFLMAFVDLWVRWCTLMEIVIDTGIRGLQIRIGMGKGKWEIGKLGNWGTRNHICTCPYFVNEFSELSLPLTFWLGQTF